MMQPVNKSRPLFRILVCLFIFPFTWINAQGITEKRNLDLYLLIGQANMAGRAEISDEVSDTLNGVFLFRDDSIHPWEGAANPLNKYSTIRKHIEMQKLGPGYAFAQEMRLLLPDTEFGMIVNARGGTAIRMWMPGTHYYNEAVRRTLQAMQYGDLKGILWLQGSSDSRKPDTYLDSLVVLISSMRSDFSNDNLPFIACELSEDKPHKSLFNDQINMLPERCEFTEVVSSESCSTIDSTHYDTRSQIILGKRFAYKLLEVSNAKSK